MFFLHRCFFAFLLIFAVPALAAPTATDWLYQGSDIPRDPAWQFGTLPNGLRYAVRRNPLPAGQVSIRVRIDAGSLNEADGERGWAHFVEHLAFRGTRSFGDRQARYIWQQLGASFGSDSNASTDYGQTVYQLDLPRADRSALDQSLAILAEMMDSARFDPAAVEGERKIVLAEKSRRSELAVRLKALADPLFYAGLKYAERDPIGVDRTLAAATPAALRNFYERWYRPDRATVVIVGDADPAMLTELLTHHFSSWQPSGPAPKEPDYGRIANPKRTVASLVYPKAPYGLQLLWLRPHRMQPDTIAREQIELTEQLAVQIINRRLEARARRAATYIAAGIFVSRDRRVADGTGLSITPREAQWREALNESFAILADAVRSPPSASEIARELSNLRTNARAAVQGESTIRSPQWAQRLVGAVDDGDVVTTAAAGLAMIDRFAPAMTPAHVGTAMKRILTGSGPRMMMLSPEPITGGDAALRVALAAARRAAPALREAERTVSFDTLPPLGPIGKEVSRQRIEDLDVTIVRFANGATLTFKKTDFEKGSISVSLRFGNGLAGLSPERPSLAWTAGVVAPSGLADLDLDAMERLLTGRRINFNFGVDEDAFQLSGATSPEDLPDQLRLLALKIAYPRWDDALFNRFKATWLDNYALGFASASARASRERGAVLHPDDRRWVAPDKATIAATGPRDLRLHFDPLLSKGRLHAIVVGDVDLDQAVAAMAATIGALPQRLDQEAVKPVSPPRPDPKPKLFAHTGDAAQAYALIGWTTNGYAAPIRDRRAITLAARILQTRLFDRLREVEGVTYSPSVSSNASETFPGWGVLTAEAQVRPESIASFFRIAREEVASLAQRQVAADEFARAQNPLVSGITRRVKTNGYWMSALEGWPSRPDLIEQTRSYLSDYKALTPEAVRAAVAAYVADEGDWSMLVLPEKEKANGD